MHAEQLLRTIKLYNKVGRYLYIEGSPGIGKTQICRQAADELGIGFQRIHAPKMKVEDMAMPVPNEARDAVNWVLNDAIPFEGDDRYPERGILLLDELGQADIDIQKLAAHLTQEREMYGRKLKDGWQVIGTGNRLEDRAGAVRILSHLDDRGGRCTLDVDLNGWCNWALDNGIHRYVVAYVRFAPQDLNTFDPAEQGSATPRSWAEGISPVVDIVDPDLEYEVFKGEIGEAVTHKFRAFCRMARDLPNPDVVLMDPEGTPIPEDKPDVQHALAGALAARASEANMEAIVAVSRRLSHDVMVYLIRDSIRQCPEVQNTKAFTDWAITDGADVLV
jgi:MoxR-like ATPase